MNAPPKTPSPQEQTNDIQNLALKLGFHLVGFTPADALEEAGRHFEQWLTNGYAGEMAYLHKRPEDRSDVRRRFPQAKSIIALALNYYQDPREHPEAHEPESALAGKIARYAWGEDYHLVIEKKLETLISEITQRGGQCWKAYVDHGPLLERAVAQRAGLGFIGKNTTLITPEYGSWVFLAEVVTDMAFVYDAPTVGSECGTCRRCIEACPTDALREPYRLDARRCLSYLTIENKGEIPEEQIEHLDGWLFGCDICQEVCPYNHGGQVTNIAEFSPEYGAGHKLSLEHIDAIPDQSHFKQQFKKSPLLRTKLKGLQRNAKALRQSIQTEGTTK